MMGHNICVVERSNMENYPLYPFLSGALSGMATKEDPDQDALLKQSDLELQCLLIPICLNT